jgi:hypothetical protein
MSGWSRPQRERDRGHTTAFCLGFRNWHPRHLARCLVSVRSGTPSPIVVVDLGTDEAEAKTLRGLVAGVEGRLIYAPRPQWSRSVALNLAAQLAPPDVTRYVFTDADMIFPRTWFHLVAAADPAKLWLTRSRDLSEAATAELPSPPAALPSDAWLLEHSTEHPLTGKGGAMVVPAEWFWKVGGFDEFYQIWGAEDEDLVERARWDGLPLAWLPPPAWVAHQWHDRTWPTPAQFEQVHRNRAYYKERLIAQGPILRNVRP